MLKGSSFRQILSNQTVHNPLGVCPWCTRRVQWLFLGDFNQCLVWSVATVTPCSASPPGGGIIGSHFGHARKKVASPYRLVSSSSPTKRRPKPIFLGDVFHSSPILILSSPILILSSPILILSSPIRLGTRTRDHQLGGESPSVTPHHKLRGSLLWAHAPWAVMCGGYVE